MQIFQAPADLRDAIRAIISDQMAEALIQRRSDLGDLAECRADLLAHGFGQASVAHLIERAVAAANAAKARH